MFCQNNKPEQIITPTESNKQRTSKNIFQRIEEGLQKIQETAFPDGGITHKIYVKLRTIPKKL